MVAVLHDNSELAGSVSRDCHEGHVACLRDRHACWERAERNGRQVDQGRVKPGGPALVRVAANAAPESCRVVKLGRRDEDLGVGKVAQAARVIGMEMGHDDAADIGRQDPQLLKLRADLLLGLDVFANGEPEERLPAREVAGL